MKFKSKFFFLLFVLYATYAGAQVSHSSELFITMKKLDSLLFEEGFNKCNSSTRETIIATDLEFYHDKGGFQDRAAFIERMDKNICSSPGRITRKPVAGSIEVFPLEDNGRLYGALQTGFHEFYINEPGSAPRLTGIARFAHYWELINGEWKLKRVFSYDHKPAGN